MQLEYVPLLQMQRDIYTLPRGMARFQSYLKTMVNERGDDLDYPPLAIVNPMAKEHVTAMLDQLLAMDVDGLAAREAEATAAALPDAPGSFRASLVVADDAMGGWTNRFSSELGLRLGVDPHHKRFWVTGVLWSGDGADEQRARETIRAAIYRTAYVLRHGPARTLRQILAQEGYAMAAAGCTTPALDADDLAYTAEVIAPMLDADDHPTLIACLFGDAAARQLGYRPQGLSDWAGLALALHQGALHQTL